MTLRDEARPLVREQLVSLGSALVAAGLDESEVIALLREGIEDLASSVA